MKSTNKFLLFLLAVSIVFACAGCGSGKSENAPSGSSGQESSEERPEKYSQDEYVLYQNVFFKDYAKEIDGSKVEKEGVFTSLYDAYSGQQRYYVWGYYDQTKCCDWQWEIVPQEGEELPPVGSLVNVTGTFTSDESALDGYWITDARIEPETVYTGSSAETDMLAMSDTLERVQIYNILYHPEAFQDKEYLAYGRIASMNLLEDPYYDDSWEINFTWDGEIPGIGTLVVLSGTIQDGTLIVRSLNKM